jgi:hypothetical protein
MVQALSIRTKLIMAILALVASVALMGATADDAHAAVTEIRTIHNYTGKTVYAWNHESGRLVIIKPDQTAFFNQWVPWCTSMTDFYNGHYMEVGYIDDYGVKVHRYSIWQRGDWIRYTNVRGYQTYAPAMPGMSGVGGRRDLILRNLDDPPSSTSYGARLSFAQ